MLTWRERLRRADAALVAELSALARVGTRGERAVARLAAPACRLLLRGRISSLRLALYGRYCGPGHSGPGVPVDRIDAACRRHDRAYSLPVLPALAHSRAYL